MTDSMTGELTASSTPTALPAQLPPDVAKLLDAGLSLVPIPRVNGKPSKAPRHKGWNLQRTPANPNGYSSQMSDFLGVDWTDCNFGLYHGASNTLALDIDDLERTKQILDDAAGVTLTDWLEDAQRVEIKSPKPNRGKLLFTFPPGFAGAQLRQLKHGAHVIFELRCGNCQDVIIGQHPEGGAYQFIGDPAAIPEAPAVLLDMLQHWDAWVPCFDSALGIEVAPPPVAPQRPQQGDHLPGRRDPIAEFNQSHTVGEILTRNNYTHAGGDRFRRPGSTTGTAGVSVMQDCKDGVERVYSHGGDALNDGWAHDAFDCYRLLECGGDWAKALAWNPEITKDNQRLYMQERAKNTTAAPHSHDNGLLESDPNPPFPFRSAADLTAHPIVPDWLVEGVIERSSLNLLFGAPGTGKSLFALDWGFCLATGLEWHGRRTKACDVVIVAGEGFAGMARRLKALEVKYQMPAPERLFISQRPANLSDSVNAQWVADTVRGLCHNPGLVVVDTLHRNMDGDENSSQDIGRFIANLDKWFKPLGAAVLVVHHSGHAVKDRSRGSSSIRAAMDGEFGAAKGPGGGVTLTCYKAKDFEPPAPLQFSLRSVPLDWRDNDEPLTSVYLEHEGEAQPENCRLSPREGTILASLEMALMLWGDDPTPGIKTGLGNVPVVPVETWREMAYQAITADSKHEVKPAAKKMAFNRCRQKLLDRGVTGECDDFTWLVV